MAFNKPSDINLSNEPTLGLFPDEEITINNSKLDISHIPNEEIPSINSTYSTRTVTMTNQKLRTIPVQLDEQMLAETDRPSSQILSNDPVSDPKRGMTSFNTVVNMTNEEHINTETITEENTTVVEEPSITLIEEPVQVVDIDKEMEEKIKEIQSKKEVEFIKEEEEDFEITLPSEEEEKVVEEIITKVEEKETIKMQNEPVKKAGVIAKPVSTEDEFIDLNISTIGKEEVTPVETPIEDLFTPFDPTTPNTQTTEKNMTETVIPNFGDDEFAKLIDQINAVESSNNREAQRNVGLKLRNPKSYEARAYRAIQFKSERQGLEQTALNDAIEDNHQITNSIVLDGTTYRDPKTSKSSLARLENGAIIAEKDSFPMVMALIGGLRKVHFYNSGFWVVVRSPLISELHTYYTRCQQETRQYGRIFGQLSYLPADIEISRAGFDLFKTCIVDSNLESWKLDDVLERNLSSDDEHTYLWALASLMFPEGTEIEYVCSNDNCHYIDRVTIDLAKIRYFDYTRLGAEALKFCHSSEKRTDADIIRYKEEILQSYKSYPIDNEWTVTIGSPSMKASLDAKTNFVDDMTMSLNLDDFSDIDSFITARYFKILSPWINQVRYTNPNDGKNIYLNYVLDKVVDALQLRYNNLPELVINHMKKSKISYFCYSYNACPSCGAVPPSEIKGMIPCDMQQSFFTLMTELLK